MSDLAKGMKGLRAELDNWVPPTDIIDQIEVVERAFRQAHQYAQGALLYSIVEDRQRSENALTMFPCILAELKNRKILLKLVNGEN